MKFNGDRSNWDSTHLKSVTNHPPETASGTRRATPFAANVIEHQTSIPTALTLMFAPGTRPDANALLRLAEKPVETTKFAISHLPDLEEGWLELISMGLTFDVSGLMPFEPAPALLAEHMFGLESVTLEANLEALRIVPGPHLSGGRMLLPIIRVLAGLGAELARLPGLRAVGWDAAHSWMAPAWFMSSIRAWLVGGTFPALGLTALSQRDSGAFQSEGLSLFTGYEVLVEPVSGEEPQDTAKLAARAIHVLAQSGTKGLEAITDGKGRGIFHDDQQGLSLLRLWRKS